VTWVIVFGIAFICAVAFLIVGISTQRGADNSRLIEDQLAHKRKARLDALEDKENI